MEYDEFQQRTQEIFQARWEKRLKRALELCRSLGEGLDREPAPSNEQRIDQLRLTTETLLDLGRAKEAYAVFEACHRLLPATTARTRAYVLSKAAEAAARLKRWQDTLRLVRRAVNERLTYEPLYETQKEAQRGCELLAGLFRGALRRELRGFATDVAEPAPSRIDLALAEAATLGQAAVIHKLVAKGAAVNLLIDGVAPLHRSTSAGHVDSVRALLTAGAWPDRPDTRGEAASQYAARVDDPTLLEALLDAGACSSVEGRDGASLLYLAASAGKTGVVRRLLMRGMDPMWRDASWKTPAEAASEQGHADLAAMLVAAPRPAVEDMSVHYRFRDEVCAVRTFYELIEDATNYEYATVHGAMRVYEASDQAHRELADTMNEANQLSTEALREWCRPQREEYLRSLPKTDRYGRVPGCSHAQLEAAFDRYAHAMARLEQESQAAYRVDEILLIQLSDGSIVRKAGHVAVHAE